MNKATKDKQDEKRIKRILSSIKNVSKYLFSWIRAIYESKHLPLWLTVLVTAGFLFVTYLNLVQLEKQTDLVKQSLKQYEQQTEIMRQTSLIVERPYIYLKADTSRREEVESDTINLLKYKNQFQIETLGFPIVIINEGKTPAFIEFFSYYFLHLNNNEFNLRDTLIHRDKNLKTFSLKEIFSSASSTVKIKNRVPILSGGATNAIVRDHRYPLHLVILNSVTDKNGWLYAHFYIVYKDLFEQWHDIYEIYFLHVDSSSNRVNIPYEPYVSIHTLTRQEIDNLSLTPR